MSLALGQDRAESLMKFPEMAQPKSEGRWEGAGLSMADVPGAEASLHRVSSPLNGVLERISPTVLIHPS